MSRAWSPLTAMPESTYSLFFRFTFKVHKDFKKVNLVIYSDSRLLNFEVLDCSNFFFKDPGNPGHSN